MNDLAPLHEVMGLVLELFRENRIMRDSLGVTPEQVTETINALVPDVRAALMGEARRDFLNSLLWPLLLEADRKLRTGTE